MSRRIHQKLLVIISYAETFGKALAEFAAARAKAAAYRYDIVAGYVVHGLIFTVYMQK